MIRESSRGYLSPFDAVGEQKGKLTPAERTRIFFNQDVSKLAEDLQDREIIDTSTGKRIVLTEVEPWEKMTVGKRYDEMRNMQPGDLFAFYFPLRRMTQSLVVATDKDGVGACVRIKRASRFDPEKQTVVPMEREGELARFLELAQQQESAIRTLAFIDESDSLYLVGESRAVIQSSQLTIDPEQANQALTDLINGEK
ncbi:hypothetical protein HYT02_01380 [Candidatus Gottesmanbacteria bacterium]|nr:hypothetical protein [Candidatus Gottesmanbacteria bacterium]